MKENLKYIVIGFLIGIFILIMAGIIPALLTIQPEPAAEPADQPAQAEFNNEIGVLYTQGLESASKGEFEEAAKSFIKASQIDPDRADIAKELGKTYIELNDMMNAKKYIAVSIKLDPDNADAQFQTARIKVFDKKYKEALKILDNIIKTRKDEDRNIYLYSMLLSADIYITLEEYRKARDIADKVIEMSPGNSWAARILQRTDEGPVTD